MRGPSKAYRIGPVVALLLVLFFIRAHRIAGQEPFIDEGLHVSRAVQVWHFDTHPGHFAHGKLLLYYWLGLFDPQPITGLYTIRTAIALFAPLGGAALYALGRCLSNHTVGLLALGLYAVFPLAVFYERMALADPFAAAFVSLLAWRSVAYARHPTRREGAVIGILAALALLAKLTMVLTPLLAPAATLIFGRREPRSFRWWSKTYLPGLLIAGGIVILVWMPIVIPALLVRGTDDAFILVNPPNLQQVEDAAPLNELRMLLPQLQAYIGPGVLIGFAPALLLLLHDRRARRLALFVAVWLLLLLILLFVAAKGIRSRYLMPLAGPLVLLAAYSLWRLWNIRARRRVVHGVTVMAAVLWLAGFALPFLVTAWTDPNHVPLERGDVERYFSGNFGGEAFRQAATLLEREDAQHIYAAEGTCQMLYFFTARPVHCLEDVRVPRELLAFEVSYVVFNGHEKPIYERPPDDPFDDAALGLDTERLALYPRPLIGRDVYVWRVRSLLTP